MEREAMELLVRWKNSEGHRPLMIRGLRQTGKTWLVEEFGRRHYHSTVTVNLENRELHKAFEHITEPQRIIKTISLMTGCDIDESTLIFIDEIQECPNAMTSLKYFCEKSPEYQIIAAGSLLGVSVGQGRKYPVGKVDEMTLHPMNFREFLMATGNVGLSELLKEYDVDMISSLSSRMTDLLKTYLCVGGMPAAVSEYVATGDVRKVRKVQNDLLLQYESDMSNHPPTRSIIRMREVWNSIPGQLSKESGSKFVYSMIGKGGASRYMEAIQWLVGYGLIVMVGLAEKPAVPLSSVSNGKAFKLFVADVGLLGAKAGLDPSLIISGDRLFTEFKGAMTEQYVLQELISLGYNPYYWSNGKNEIDFMIEDGGRPIPVEVKSSVSLKSQSLKAFRDRYGVELCVRTSLTGFRDEGWLLNVPLYAISCLPEALRSHSGDTTGDYGAERLRLFIYRRERWGSMRKYDLVCFDMDGTLTTIRSSWRWIHDYLGVDNEPSYRAFINGEIDENEFMRRDIHLWMETMPGITIGDVAHIFQTMPLVGGIQETVACLRDNGIACVIVSGGIDIAARMLTEEFGFNEFIADSLETDADGRLTGEGIRNLNLRDKGVNVREYISKYGTSPERTVSIGNSYTDIPMFQNSGMSIAFNPTDEYTSEAATHTIFSDNIADVLDYIIGDGEI